MNSLRLCRSALFLPASNNRAIEKARTLHADLVILDLEDAVKPEDKDVAREAAVAAVDEGFEDKLVAVRINAAGRWQEDDIRAVAGIPADFVLLPKVEDANEASRIAAACEKSLLAMIETARGVLAAASIAPRTAGLVAGTNDLSADLAIPPGSGRAGLSAALQQIVLAARSAGVAAFDGVYNKLEDMDGLAAECREGRAFGFDGKSLIHPAQIETANRIFGPSEGELEAARRLLAAASGGAERFEGRMIESMHVDQARALIAKARG